MGWMCSYSLNFLSFGSRFLSLYDLLSFFFKRKEKNREEMEPEIYCCLEFQAAPEIYF